MDRQRQMIAASGMTLGVVAIMAGVLFWPRAEMNAGAQGAPTPGGPGKGGPAGKAGGLPQPSAGQQAGGAAALPGQAPPVVYRPPYRPRKDPFKLIWKIPPPPPYVFQEVQPIRVA